MKAFMRVMGVACWEASFPSCQMTHLNRIPAIEGRAVGRTKGTLGTGVSAVCQLSVPLCLPTTCNGPTCLR